MSGWHPLAQLIAVANGSTLLVLGSNLGDRISHLTNGISVLGRVADIHAVSPVYESPAADYLHQPAFLNVAVRLTTTLGPLRFLMWCKSIEYSAGRRPGIRFGPRPLDVDVITMGSLAIRSHRITLPHPRFTGRAFMVAPLADIASTEIPPDCDVPIAELDRRLGRTGLVKVAHPATVWKNTENTAP